MTKLRVAVIGMGPIGNIHSTMYKEDALAELVAVCDWDKARADAGAAKFGVQAFYDVQQMLETVRPEVVSVATGGHEYGSEHYLPTIQALKFGCHVLGEKPISNEIEEAEEMVATARANGRCYGINLNHRFTPAARLARKWVDEGRIGHQLFCNMSMWIKNARHRLIFI
jgi:predicted dehydrogenase